MGHEPRSPEVIPAASSDAMVKPMARTSRVSLFARRVETELSSAALDLIFEHATVLSEGDREDGRFFGSTMITFDLERTTHLVSDVCNERTTQQLGELLAKDRRIAHRARALGAREARKHASCSLAHVQVDLRVECKGNLLHLDLDVEAMIED